MHIKINWRFVFVALIISCLCFTNIWQSVYLQNSLDKIISISLDYSYSNLMSLNQLKKLKHLESIRISHADTNDIKQIPTFNSVTSLQIICSDICISDIKNTFPNIKKIHLFDSNILVDDFYETNQLRDMDLISCNISISNAIIDKNHITKIDHLKIFKSVFYGVRVDDDKYFLDNDSFFMNFSNINMLEVSGMYLVDIHTLCKNRNAREIIVDKGFISTESIELLEKSGIIVTVR